MKITNSELKQIILEEIEQVALERQSSNKETPDWLHGLLDVAGIVGDLGFGAGAIFDAANATLYLKEGEYLMAALSALSILPALGDLVGKGTKLGILLSKADKHVKAGKQVRIKKGVVGQFLAKHMPTIRENWQIIGQRFGLEASEAMLQALEDIAK
jgi:hypothetical protein